MILIAELINHFVNGIVNMATVKKVSKVSALKTKKYQNGGDTTKVDKDIPSWAAKFNAQQEKERKNPKLAEERRRKEDSTMKANYIKGRAEDRARYIKEGYKVEDRPSGSTVYTKQKNGGKTMLKRKDGSVSQRGLWDNIRANRGSGKKPTAAMLKQEKKIKAKSKKK